MTNNVFKVYDIPCLDFLVESESVLYVGPKLSWWKRRKLRKVQAKLKIIYLYDHIDGITKEQLGYTFPGVTFPSDFSAATIYQKIRATIEAETGIAIAPESIYFIGYDGAEFVVLKGMPKLNEALSLLEEEYDEFQDVIFFRKCETKICACMLPDERDPREIYELDSPPSPEEVKRSINSLLLTGFPVEIIKSWLEERVMLSRLRVTRQFKILLLDYDKEVRMGPLPKTVFLFYLMHPEGVKFNYLQDYKDDLLTIYNHLCKNDSPEKMRKSIDSLVDPLNNSISEKCHAIKEAFEKAVNEDVAKFYYVRGRQGTKKTIALDRSLVEWECDLVE